MEPITMGILVAVCTGLDMLSSGRNPITGNRIGEKSSSSRKGDDEDK